MVLGVGTRECQKQGALSCGPTSCPKCCKAPTHQEEERRVLVLFDRVGACAPEAHVVVH